MSVGDFVNIVVANRNCRLHRLVSKLDELPPVERFGYERMFVYVPPRRSRHLGFLGRMVARVLRLARISQAWRRLRLYWDSRPKSLISVMSAAHDVGLQQTRLGVEAVGVPFPHVLLLSSKDYRGYRLALENQLTAQLNQHWENYVDPLVGIRTRMLVSNRVPEDELVAFFGDGVFAPRAGERPVGRIALKFEGYRDVFEPKIAGDLPGGLYRGQSSLAFSGSAQLTPATSDALTGVPGTFCLRARPQDSTEIAHVLDWDPPADGDQLFEPVNDPIEPLPSGVDGAFRIEFANAIRFEVYVIENVHAARLHHAPCRDEFCFAIVGVIAPTRRKSFNVNRWWIDLDRKGHLVASAMRLPKYSIVCEGGSIATWNWSAPHAPADHPTLLQEFDTPDGKVSALIAPQGAPFGWLNPPARTVRATFAPADDAVCALDWLDYSGAVQNQQFQTERLASHLHRAAAVAFMPGLAGGEGSESILVREPGQLMFSYSWRGRFRPRTQFMAGPFIIEVTGDRDV
jgi:hypothetical protein